MKKEKIGCVIAYNEGHNNYGTALVGYALIKKIQQIGYDCEIIMYIKQLSLLDKVSFVLNAIRAGEFNTLYQRISEKKDLKTFPEYAKSIDERTKAVNNYKDKKLKPLFKSYIGYSDLRKGSTNYKAVVVGSDQVWTPMSLPNKFYNLLFVSDNIPKIAYASSFGVSLIPNFQKKATGYFLDRFSAIGVREQQGKVIVDSLSTKGIAKVVADPTLLLSREEWEEEIKDARPKEIDPYIFCYFLGTNRESREAVNELKKRTGYKIITIRHMDEYVPEDEFFGDEAPYYVDPNDFVKYISDASFVCTDSFHCTIFSIIFNRKFMTFYRFANSSKTSRNSRIDSLFDVLGISRERIYSGNICDVIDKDIDYNEVEVRLNKLRNESLDFLSTSLNSIN